MNQTIEILILAGLAISGAGYLITEIIWLRKRAKSEEEKRSGKHEEREKDEHNQGIERRG